MPTLLLFPNEGDPQSTAAVTIIGNQFERLEKINELLHEYSHMIIGRMGMPYRKGGVFIINAISTG